MICPFEPEEKQALLEAGDGGRQARLLIALMEMETLAEPGGSTPAIDHRERRVTMTLPIEEAGPDPRLLDLLVCPLTKAALRYDRERNELVSEQAARPIRSATVSRSCWSRRPAAGRQRMRPRGGPRG